MFFGLLQFFFLFSYITSSYSFPQPLSSEEERKYLNEYAMGSEDAKNVLIERNLRLVAHVVKKYSNHIKDSDDLISIGTIGLIKAITTFRPEKGTRLATYAARCIDNAILLWVTRITLNGQTSCFHNLEYPVITDEDIKQCLEYAACSTR